MLHFLNVALLDLKYSFQNKSVGLYRKMLMTSAKRSVNNKQKFDMYAILSEYFQKYIIFFLIIKISLNINKDKRVINLINGVTCINGSIFIIVSDGNTVKCCGIEKCSNISEEKVYEDPAPEACCTAKPGYSFEYTSHDPCKEVPEGCTLSSKFVVRSSGIPTYTCSGSCPEQETCEEGTKKGYQQYAWEDPSIPWTSVSCPKDASYTKSDCQTICNGTMGCKKICKYRCESIQCSKNTVTVKVH